MVTSACAESTDPGGVCAGSTAIGRLLRTHFAVSGVVAILGSYDPENKKTAMILIQGCTGIISSFGVWVNVSRCG